MDQQDVLVSILMATFNGEAFLAEQMESILEQTHADFELLVIDDGSSDATPAMLGDYAAREPRIRLFPSSGNRGQSQRLAELLPHAKGSLLGFADQDDIWDARRTSLLLEQIGEAALVYGRSDLIDAKGGALGQTLLASLDVAPHPDDRLVALFRPRVSGHAMLVRREAVTDAAFRRAHPYDWLIGLEAQFCGGWKYVDEAVVRHRIHMNNQMNGANIRSGWIADSQKAQQRPAGPVNRSARRGPNARPHRRRQRFVRRLEHLNFSPLVPGDAQRACGRVRETCELSWFRGTPSRPEDELALRNMILNELRPLASSEADLGQSVAALNRLVWGIAGPAGPGATEARKGPGAMAPMIR